MLPRDSLAKPFEGYPAYGAVHDVLPNEQLRGFLFDFSRIADKVIGQAFASEEVDPIPDYVASENFEAEPISVVPAESDKKPYDSRDFYRIFDVESLGVSVVEMDPSAKAARTIRTIWEGQDFGAVEQEARNEIGRSLPNIVPHLFFNRVEGVGRRLPGVSRSDVRQKLALMPDTTRFAETLNTIDVEADKIISAILKRLKQFMYPWDTTAHMTYSVFRSSTEPGQIIDIQNKTNEYLAKYPFGVQLGQLVFRHKKERNRTR